MTKRTKQPKTPIQFVTGRKEILVREDANEGTWHVFLKFPNDELVDVGSHIEKWEAEDAANDIRRFMEDC